jgi:uncharacterized protein YndB with AHSA1/START domain
MQTSSTFVEAKQSALMATLEIKRQFKASKQKVFEAWSTAENMVQWWGPKGFKTTAKTFDLKPLGAFHYSFTPEKGTAMWGKFVYQDVQAPERIVFKNSFSDEQGHVTRAPFNSQWPLEISNTLTFIEENGITTLALKGEPVNATQEEKETFASNIENMQQGFEGTFDRLEAFLSKQ